MNITEKQAYQRVITGSIKTLQTHIESIIMAYTANCIEDLEKSDHLAHNLADNILSNFIPNFIISKSNKKQKEAFRNNMKELIDKLWLHVEMYEAEFDKKKEVH